MELNNKLKGKEKGAMAKNIFCAALMLVLLSGVMFAQGGSGSDWQYCNAFNVVEPDGTPGGPVYGHDIPSWYTTDYSTVSSFTPASPWRRGSYEIDPVTGEETPVRMSHENVVLRLDLLSATSNIDLRGVKLTIYGSRDFDPNEDLTPIHPDSAADHFGVMITESDTLTGVQFYVEKGEGALSDVDILDRIDIRGIAEQLIIDTLIQPRDTYDPSSASHHEDTLAPAYVWEHVSTDPGSGWKTWEATFHFEDAIQIPYEGTFNSTIYGLPFYRIWVALQMAGCHDCESVSFEGGIEGISNSDSFYVEIAERTDLLAYRYAAPMIDLVDMTSTLTDVIRSNVEPDPADASRWARSEMIKGWDEIKPYLSHLWPRDQVSTNDWYSEHVLCDETNDSIFTADSVQPIAIVAKDQGTCVDSAFMEIRYINDEFYGLTPGTNFPGRVDSIIWHDPLEFPWDEFNGGHGIGWEWNIKHSYRDLGAWSWSSTGWSGFGLHSEALADYVRPGHCGFDTFAVEVGNDFTTSYLPPYLDGSYIQVTFRAFSRTNNRRYDYGFTLSPGIMNDTIWTFKVDLSGPNAEMTCPDNTDDNDTREFAGPFNREDVIEGIITNWIWLADSLPTLVLDVYDNYQDVHDITHHGIRYAGGMGGSGINWRDFEITFAIEHCDGSWDTVVVNEDDMGYGVWADEEDNGYESTVWVNFEELVTYHSGWSGIVPFQSGDFIYVLLSELYDDPDYGQGSQLGGWDEYMDTIPSGTWGSAGNADGNYGCRNTFDNHVPVVGEVAGVVPGYTEFAYDTLGILRIDLEGPTAPDTFYYPPNQWVTSDSFQIITCNIYDQIGCVDYDQNVDVSGSDPWALYHRTSGIYAGSMDQEARICVNLKVRGCDGSWHPYYHSTMGTIPDGANFCTGDPAIGAVLDLTKKVNEWGLRVTYDPYRRLPTQARFRPGDKVCVTVYAWDNAVADCQSEDGVAPPWDDENDPWIGSDDLYCSGGDVSHTVDYEVPSRNEGYDRLDPDMLYYTQRHIARWSFFVDIHPPVFVEGNMEQTCNDTMYLHFTDVSANVHGVYCDNWVAKIGESHGELVEGADIMLIFTDTLTEPGVTHVDTILYQDMKYGDIHVDYHQIPGREYQYYYAELKPNPDDERGAMLLLYGDGTDATCHFFQPYDHVEWELYAGDSPDVPWYPATQRCVSGGCYRWWHTIDPYSSITSTFMAWRYGTHDYTGLNIDTLDWSFWKDITYNDYENPNWDLIQTGNFDIIPETWLNMVEWFNDEAYDAYWTASTYNYPPDLKGTYSTLKACWSGWFDSYAPIYEEGDVAVYSEMESCDPYVGTWVNDLNFIVTEIYTCTDSIVWECLAGSDPDDDTLMGRTPHVTLDLYDAEGTHVWTVDEWYDCHCSPCFLHYYPARTGCVDWGRLHIGPMDQTEQWLYTIRRIDTLETDPELVTDTIVGWQHEDSLVVTFTFTVREPNYFGEADNYVKHTFKWFYQVDMQPPTAEWRVPDATTGYDEVNCYLIHDSNHTIRLRLEDIYDANVGCAPGTLMAPNWTTAWPIPAVDPCSDFVKYEMGTAYDVDAGLVWNPSTHYLWSNEGFEIHNCAPEDYVAGTMDLGTPGIDVYHGLDRTGATPVPMETHIDIDTIFVADSLYVEAIAQDRLGNCAKYTSAKVGIDNGLPKIKGFALSTLAMDTLGTDSTGTPILGDPYFQNWDDNLFKLPWEVPDQDSLVGIYNFSPVCTVFVRIWFNDNMDMREADHLSGHIVRFQPEGWTHWFPVLPLETVTAGPGGLVYPFAQYYVDYSETDVFDARRRPDHGGIRDESIPSGTMESLDAGWNSDREWIGYMVLAGEGAMDGIAKLRVQGFDDNAGNYMMPMDLPLRIVTGEPRFIDVEWPKIDQDDPAPEDALVISGWSTPSDDSTDCSFVIDPAEHDITGYWDDSMVETDSVVFKVFWHDTTWASIPDVDAYTYHWVEDNMYSDNIWHVGETTWVSLPSEDLDLLHDYYTTLGGPTLPVVDMEIYATIVMEVYSRFRPVNPFMETTIRNVLIDNMRPDPDLTDVGGGQMVHGEMTVLPYGSTKLKLCWTNGDVDQWDKMAVWLRSIIDGTEYPLIPAGALGDEYAEIGSSAPLYYDGALDAVCLEYETSEGLPPGMWTLSWKAFDALHVVSGQADDGTITDYWYNYHTDCEFWDWSDTLFIPRPPFLARGDNFTDAMHTVAANYPAADDADDIFPWWDSDMEQKWPDWPTWGWIDTAGIGAIDTLPDFFRVSAFYPLVQVTTYNNPDISSGDPDPLMHPYVEAGGYMGDSLYVVIEKMPEDSTVEYIDLNIADYYGGSISGSNPEITVRLDDTDLYTYVADTTTRMFWVYKWTLDDMDNRFDGLVDITATEHRRRAGTTDEYRDWDNHAYILLDTYDPSYSVDVIREATSTPAMKSMNMVDYPYEPYIYVVNDDLFKLNIDWDETMFDPGVDGDPAAYFNYGDYVATRMYDNMRLSIDGMPMYGSYDDANDHLESRLWDDDSDLDYWDIHHPFWRQPDFMNSTISPSSFDDAEITYTWDDQLEFFGDDVYSYNWDVAGEPEGLTAQGITYILAKGRDAAGNVLDYEEARISDAEGKVVLVDIEAPEIYSDQIIITGDNFTGYAGAFDDNYLGDNFTDMLGRGYVYIIVSHDSLGVLGDTMWVDASGGVATTPWVGDSPEPGDMVEVCAYDLAGNMTCEDVEVVPEEHCCEWVLCPDWNLLGISVMPEGGATVGDIFGTMPAYTMVGGSYVPLAPTDPLTGGMGIAIYPAAYETVSVCGVPVTEFSAELEAGWNLVGAPWDDYDFTAPYVTGDGTIIPDETRYYECGLDYVETTVLQHCRGHLVQATDACTLWVPGGGGKVVYTVKDGTYETVFEGRFLTDNTAIEFGAADGATNGFDVGADRYAIPARPGENSIVLGDGFDRDYRGVENEITWTLSADAAYNVTVELTGDWEVTYDGTVITDGQVIAVTPGEHKVVADRQAIPEEFALGSNLPNPFNAVTTIKYQLPDDGNVTIGVYSVLGKKVATLVDGEVEAGYHTIVWDGTDDEGNDVPSGIYFYRMDATGFKVTRKMTLMK